MGNIMRMSVFWPGICLHKQAMGLYADTDTIGYDHLIPEKSAKTVKENNRWKMLQNNYKKKRVKSRSSF